MHQKQDPKEIKSGKYGIWYGKPFKVSPLICIMNNTVRDARQFLSLRTDGGGFFMLSLHEKKVLIVLKDTGEESVKNTAKKAGLDEVAVMRAALWLSSKKLIKIL